MMKSVGLLAAILLLSACNLKNIKLTAQTTQYSGLVTQSIVFIDREQQHQWVCFSEINLQELTGISCQSDTALPLFSGGMVDGEFEFEYPSRYFLKIKPQNLLAYIKMSLFDDLSYNQTAIIVDKSQTAVTIKDQQRKVELTITNL